MTAGRPSPSACTTTDGPNVVRTVLIAGASGYIGSHLLAPLQARGYRVRAAAREPGRVRAPEGVEVVAADVADAAADARALEGVDTALYLVHTLGRGADYAERDRVAARTFGTAARDAGVERIVYLGGLGDESRALSDHLASRQEVGRVLAASGVPVVEFRASIVLGSGSTSFEMIRNLVEKLPAMTTPRWVRMRAQPIAIEDVVAYLVASIDVGLDPGENHRIYDIGGADTTTYQQLLSMYARKRGLTRLVIPVPVLTPGLSGWWLYLFTPKQATVGRQLAESLRYPTVVTDDAARRDFPQIEPLDAEQAIDRALAAEDSDFDGILWAEELSGTVAARPLRARGPLRRLAHHPRDLPARGRVRPRRVHRRRATAGTPSTRCGTCAASSTCSSADRVAGADAGTPMHWPRATTSNGGAWSASRPRGSYDSAPRW